ncbi:hypothetical protein ACHAXS_006762 [Conticribra weissflogii]
MASSSPSPSPSPSSHDEHTRLLSRSFPLHSCDHDNDSSPPHYDAVNHGHAYTDAILCEVATGQTAGADPLANKRVTYWSLLRDNRNFRWFLSSYLVTIAGEWFTYVASIAAIEQIQASQHRISRTSISVLVALRLLPNALFSNAGGVLADAHDRRRLLLHLDLLGSLVAMLFLLSHSLRSLSLLYLSTALQMTVAALYEPSHSSITPMIVREEPEALKKAVTLGGLSWSVMTSLGSGLGGLAVARVGIPVCFCLDGLSYLVSAGCLWMMDGTYRPVEGREVEESMEGDGTEPRVEIQTGRSDWYGTDQSTPLPPRTQPFDADAIENNNNNDEATANNPLNCCHHFHTMTIQGITYLRSKPWGPFVFLKFCAALIYGAADVLNVSFSERGSTDDQDDTLLGESGSQRLGILFGFVGIGCFVGPIVADPFTDMDRSESLERMCWISFLSMAVGCYGLSRVESFGWVCVMTSVRSAGSSIVWIDSSLLLQKFSSNHMLGRVMAVDYALATLSEAFSAMAGGMLQDDVGMTAEDVSFIMAVVGLVTLVVWGGYFTFFRVRD